MHAPLVPQTGSGYPHLFASGRKEWMAGSSHQKKTLLFYNRPDRGWSLHGHGEVFRVLVKTQRNPRHMVRAFVDVIRGRKSRSTEKKRKKSTGPTHRTFPYSFPGAQTVLLGLDAAAAAPPELHLDRLFRGAPRSLLLPAGLSAWQRGLGDGGCVRAVRCGGRCACSPPGPLLLCYPGLRFKALLPAFPACFFLDVFLLEAQRSFGKTHGHKEDLGFYSLADLSLH
ncbi:hypothetical protein XENOCAPTIV_016376 [Xenoophorus captivus]|uniref:Uncharacterized protein n=1 Tax=Xenoophorus captivus TaxID=1517983 RepID=A0ABV0R915_9TELE